MLFIPENELEKALLRAVKEPHAAPEFYRLLLSSDLLVLGSVEGHETASEAFSIEPGSKVSLVTGLKDDARYLPVFSSLARMQEYVKEESKYLRVNGRELLDMTRGGPVILNPASEYGKELTAEQVRQLLDGPGGKSRTIVGEAVYPADLVRLLAKLFTTRPEIETGWMIQVAFADRPQEPHPLIGIEIASQTAAQYDWPALMQAIEASAQTSVPGISAGQSYCAAVWLAISMPI